MNKISLIALIVIPLISNKSICQGASAPFSNEYQTGPYFGISIGPRFNMSGQKSYYAGGEGNLSIGLAKTETYPTLFQSIAKFYLGGELFIANSLQFKSLDYNGYYSQSGFSYGGDLIPGVFVNPLTFIYLRTGVVNTHFELIPTNALLPKQSSYPTGWRIGGGVQFNLLKSFDIRLEAIGAFYSGTHASNLGHPFTNQFNLGGVYKFIN